MVVRRDRVLLAVLVVLAGCSGSPTTAPTTDPGTATASPTTDRPTSSTPAPGAEPVADYETLAFDHAGVDGPAIEGGIAYPDDAGGPRRNYATLVTSGSATDRFDRSILTPEARAFVENTSFESSYLVVIQEFPASSVPDYRVEAVERTGDVLSVSINDSSPGGTADVTVETLLVRVPRSGPPPETVTVTTEDGYTFDSTAGVVRETTGDG